jgi:hypothetical protein
MSFFSKIGSTIKSTYNYMRPTKTSGENFTDAQNSAATALSEIKDAGTNAAKGLWDTVKIAKDGFIGVKAFDFIAGKIVTTKAANDLTWFVVPTVATKVVNACFNVLVKFPSQVMVGTIALTIATNPKAVLNTIKDFGSAAIDTVKAAYHAAETGFELTKAGVALGYEIGDILTGNTAKEAVNQVDFSNLTDSAIIGDLEYYDAN